MAAAVHREVLTVADVRVDDLDSLLGHYKLELVIQNAGGPITGSYWGDPEAGIMRNTVYVRDDTPIHSLLHETCHIICMTRDRRGQLECDAGGDDLEEAGVCYLQVVLAEHIGAVGRERLMQDMDAWGYSFRLGSTRKWFEQDAEDARQFLINHGLLTEEGEPTYTLRS